jgi:hypothetical protein
VARALVSKDGNPDLAALGSWERAVLVAWGMVRTQLRVSMAGVVGLDYAAAKAVLELHGLWEPEIVQGLQVIERELLAEQSRHKAQERTPTWEEEAEALVEDGWEDELSELTGEGAGNGS